MHSSKEVSPREVSPERRALDELKRELEELHTTQMREVETKLEDLQKQLGEQRLRQADAAEELRNKRQELDEEQQKFLHLQIAQQNERFEQSTTSVHVNRNIDSLSCRAQ